MVAGNFHIVVFIFLPLSIGLVALAVAMAAGAVRESRVSLWSGVFVGAIATYFAGSDALLVIPNATRIHGALNLILAANFWAATMLVLACAIRLERERRVSSAQNAGAVPTT
jgi:uncharacterized membrane protein (UPF0136 family)